MEKQSLQQLKNLELHDVGVWELEIDFTNNKVVIQLKISVEEKKDYDILKLSFWEVGSLKIDRIDLDRLFLIEVTNHKVIEGEHSSTMVMDLIQGFEKPDGELSFTFGGHEITYIQT